MLIEIFEARGFSEPDTNLDATILNLRKKYGDEIMIKKLNVLDKEMMKKHKDVIDQIKNSGLEKLPIIKLDNKIVTNDKIERLMR
jgi:CBS domain containing-hemolysin-like protein